MIHSLYQLTAKGLLKALSFLLATVLFGLILWDSVSFAQQFGGKTPFLVVLVFYGMSILWIHGIGFEIKTTLWKAVFMPLTGYLIVLFALLSLLINKA